MTQLSNSHPNRLRQFFLSRWWRDERGAETAEYAIVIMAAVALAGVLVAVVQSDAIRQVIEDLVTTAFQS